MVFAHADALEVTTEGSAIPEGRIRQVSDQDDDYVKTLTSLVRSGIPTSGKGVEPATGLGGVLSLAQLASYAKKPVVTGLWFNQQNLTLDGYVFSHCRFDRCRLTVRTTNVALDHCIIDDLSTIEYGPELVKVIHLFNSRYEWARESFPNFCPTQNDDSTISIGQGS
jgi:hypothetical protein